MRILPIFLCLIMLGSSCHRKELPSTQLRKEMRKANQRSMKQGKKQLKKNKKAVLRK